MDRHQNPKRTAPPSAAGPDKPALDFGESPAQKAFRELREKLGPPKHRLVPCGCCKKLIGQTREGAVTRPCGCTVTVCRHEDGCYKCLAHCPSRRKPGPSFKTPEDVIAHIRKGARR